MTTKNLILGSAGALALGLALIAGTASAQISYPSTPAERAETAELNRHGVTVYGPSPAEEDAYEDAQSDYQSQRDAYDAQKRAQQDDFNARQNAYRAERNSYDAQRNSYQAQRDAYDDQVRDYEDASAEPFDSDAIDPRDVARLERIDSFVDEAELADSPVEDRSGRMVGHFRYLREGRNGETMAIIALNNRRSVLVPADNLRFDPERNRVLADLSYDELARMRRA